MVERREDLPLNAESLDVERGIEARTEQLHRDLLVELTVGALGGKDARHAPAANLADNAPGAEAAPGLERWHRGEERAGHLGRGGREERARCSMGAQEPLDLGLERGVAGGGPVDVGVLLLVRQVECRVKDGARLVVTAGEWVGNNDLRDQGLGR